MYRSAEESTNNKNKNNNNNKNKNSNKKQSINPLISQLQQMLESHQCCGKKKKEEGRELELHRWQVLGHITVLNRVVRGGLSVRVRFKQRFEGGEGVSCLSRYVGSRVGQCPWAAASLVRGVGLFSGEA